MCPTTTCTPPRAVGAAQIRGREGGRQSQGQPRRALGLLRRRAAGARRAVAALHRDARRHRPRGEAVGRRAVRGVPRRRSAPASARIFRKASSSSRRFRSSPRRRRSIRRSASSSFPSSSARARSASSRPAPRSIRISTALLDRLIEIALRCPAANIEVAGHTDGDGEDAFNQALSEKRAQAVVDYLVKAGLPGTRFTATGYGFDPAGRRQRHRRRQGAEPPHRIPGEVSMVYLVTFHWGWLLASFLLGLGMGWIAVVHRAQGVSKVMARWLSALAVVVVGACRRQNRAGPLRLLARPRPDPVRLLSRRLRHRLLAARLGGVARRGEASGVSAVPPTSGPCGEGLAGLPDARKAVTGPLRRVKSPRSASRGTCKGEFVPSRRHPFGLIC